MGRLSIQDLWSKAWLQFKQHWSAGVLLVSGQFLLSFIPLVGLIINLFLPAILVNYAIKAWDSSTPFPFGEVIPKKLVIYLNVLLGEIILLLIPLLIFSLQLFDQKDFEPIHAVVNPMLILLAIGSFLVLFVLFIPYPFLVVDKGVGVIEGFRLAYQITRPNIVQVVSFLVIAFLVNIGGMLLCFVGLLVTQPLTYIALAGLYRKLTGSSAEHKPPSYL